jgi:hypothetical protein
MEEHEFEADPAPGGPPSGRRTAQQRSRAQLLLSAQRARLEQIDADLASQFDELLRTAADGLAADAQTTQREFERRDRTLAEQVHQHELSAEQLRQQQESLARKQAELETARTELAEAQQALRRAQAEAQHDAEQLARSRGRSQQLEERLAREAEQLEIRREQTKNQRRRIAQELKTEKASQQHEVDELRRTIEHMRIAQQRGVEQATAELQQKREDLERRERQLAAQRLTESDGRDDQLRQLSAALSEARQAAATSTATASELLQTVEELRQSHERLRESTEVSEQRHGELQRKHELLQQQYQEVRSDLQAATDGQARPEWETERANLVARAAEAEQKLAQIDPQRMEDSQRRFELAISDVRDLKRRNAELEEQLIGARAAAIGTARQRPDQSVSADWEATKRRMLESLEADDQADDPEKIEQRLTVESTIQITDEIVARKDREIVELQMLLSQQSSNIGAVAVGAAAIADNFDRDELIQQEREKLQQLQAEWRDKLRQAEIDISIERARIARQRAEVEEKVSAYDSVRAQHGADDGASNPSNPPKQPSRGRWLSRLGLKDDSR